MKKFKFRLESALSLRRFRKQQASGALAKATLKRNTAQRHFRQSEEKLSQVEAQSVPARGARVTAGEMVRCQISISYYRNEVKRREEQYREALDLEKHCYHDLMLARQEEEGLLQLKDKAKEAYKVELIRSDEITVQEFTNARRRSALV